MSCRKVCKEYQSYEARFWHMEEYKEGAERQAKEQKQQPDGVTLATLHSAKGLEYDIVYLVDVKSKGSCLIKSGIRAGY